MQSACLAFAPLRAAIGTARAPSRGSRAGSRSTSVRNSALTIHLKWGDSRGQSTLGALVHALQTARSKVVHCGAKRMSAPDRLLWEEHLQEGAHWSGVLRRGVKLRITDLEGGANVATLFYKYEEKLERYNMADTLKAQHTAFLTKGNVCYSDMGRILCSITEDTCGWHDTFCGVSNAAMVAARFGKTRFQEQRNAYYKNGYDSLLNELGKYGLGKRDIVSNVNFFSKVSTDDAGDLRFHVNHSKAGSYVDLRFEMHTLLVLSTCQHPLDPSLDYAPRPVRISAFTTAPAAADDICRTKCPENARGFRNTEMLYA
jgi:urea carboxylase-associated protein 2